MARKPTIKQKNSAKIDDLLKQKVSGSAGFINKDLKRFIADELINSSNNNNKLIRLTGSNLQKRYNQYQKYYDKLFTSGLEGHYLHTGTIERNAKAHIDAGTPYYIKEGGKEKKVSFSELAYKMELLAHKLSTKHDIAFTKFKPTYFLLGKGKYKVVINIPSLKDIDMEEATVEEIQEFFDSEGVEVIVSDPSNIKDREARKKSEYVKKRRQKSIEKAKIKHYRQWKKKKPSLRGTKRRSKPKK